MNRPLVLGENIASDTAVRLNKVWYRTSHLDSTLFAVDSQGEVISHTIYDPWGNPQSETKTDLNYTGLDNRNNYTGYTWDVTLELYFAQARFYDPTDHRFTQEDPIKDGDNWYGYVGNDPLNKFDPFGTNEIALALPHIPQFVMCAGAVLTTVASFLASPAVLTAVAVVAVLGVVYLAVNAGIAYYNSTRAWDTPQNMNIAKKNNLKVSKLIVKKFSKTHSSGTTAQALEGKSYMQTVQCPSASATKNPVIVYGSSGEYVITLQRYLAQYGYYNDRIDGNFGPNTDKAVRSFQRVNGLSVDGSVGPLTWENILSGNVLTVEEAGEDTPAEEKDGESKDDKTPDAPYPGDDGSKPPREGLEWRGQKPVGGDKGSWVDPKTGEQFHPDLNHKPPIGPHWDYTPGKGMPTWRIFPDGTILPN